MASASAAEVGVKAAEEGREGEGEERGETRTAAGSRADREEEEEKNATDERSDGKEAGG